MPDPGMDNVIPLRDPQPAAPTVEAVPPPPEREQSDWERKLVQR